MDDLFKAITFVLQDPKTAWLGYSTIALVVVVVGFSVASSFMVKLIFNIKELTKHISGGDPTDYEKHVKNELNISPILSEIRHNTHSDRVGILQFHNGIHSIANNSLLKVSMTHERLDLNMSSIMNSVQGWPANYFGVINDKIFDRQYVAFPCMAELEAIPELRGLYDQFKDTTKSFYFFPVTDLRGKVFGIGIVQYERHDHKMDEEWLRWCNDMFSNIGTLLAGVDIEEHFK
jgi:hypothetical protein